MPMRYLLTPPAIVLVHPETGSAFEPSVTVDFATFAHRLLQAESWSGNYAALCAAKSLRQCLTGCQTGSVISLADDDWQCLRTQVENPPAGNYGYLPAVMHQLLPFLDAIINATVTPAVTGGG